MGNDSVLMKIFTSTLRGLIFIWFIQLPQETIKVWSNVEREFLGRFFEDETKISVHSLLTTKHKEDEIVKSFMEHFEKC